MWDGCLFHVDISGKKIGAKAQDGDSASIGVLVGARDLHDRVGDDHIRWHLIADLSANCRLYLFGNWVVCTWRGGKSAVARISLEILAPNRMVCVNFNCLGRGVYNRIVASVVPD